MRRLSVSMNFRTASLVFLWLIALFGVPLPANSQELKTTYMWGGINYNSLAAAENALWNASFVGSAFYTYQYTWLNGAARKYHHPATTEFTQGPDLVWWSGGIGCNDGPIFDQYGKDWCHGIVNYNLCCDSRASWEAQVQVTWPPEIGCSITITDEGPWVFEGYIQGSKIFPEEIQTGMADYSKFIDAEFGPGWSSLCGTNHDFTLNKRAPVYCPPGYQYFQPINGVWTCFVTTIANIQSFGAVNAEPDPQECSAGNPCHPRTGDKTLSETDFESDTLPLVRHYRAQPVYPDYSAMGRGWSHNYSGRILFEEGAVKVIGGKGEVERFKCADSPACSVYRSQSQAGNVLRPVTGGWDASFENGETRHFDSNSRLVLITDTSDGFRQVAITYNASGNVDEVIDQRGRALQFSYGPTGLVSQVTLPDGQVIQYQYEIPVTDTTPNPKRNLVKVIRQNMAERVYRYEDADEFGNPRLGNLLTGITDENGSPYATYAYDDHGRVILSEHANGADRVELTYTKRPGESYQWSITQVTMPLGEVVTYDMEGGVYRKVTEIADSRGLVAMSYDPAKYWRASKTDREGNQTTYQYDNLHETSRTKAAGTANARTIETDWNNTVNRVAEIREPGKTTSHTYNLRGQILTKSITDIVTLETRAWTYTYFEIPSLGPLIGQVETVDGPRTDVSDITTYEYYTTDHPSGDYVIGDLKAVVNALGHRTDYLKYDGSGRPLQVRDANGVLTVLTYHPRGWISSRTTDGKITSFSYDPVGNLTRVTQPDGSFIAYDYDDAHRLQALEDNFGNRIEYTLDAAGNRTAEKTYDNLGVLARQLARQYDQINRLQKLIDGNLDETVYGYDGNGNRTSTLDANLNTTSFQYDGLDRLKKTIDAVLGETLMAYDDRDNLVSVTDPIGNVTQYTYDGLDNQIRLDNPDSGTTVYEYDAAGNRTAATDARGVRTEYFYDALNRLTDIAYPDSTLDVSFTYDTGANGKGRLTGISDAAGTAAYTYDARGNLLSETRTLGTEEYVTFHAYNSADRLVQLAYSG